MRWSDALTPAAASPRPARISRQDAWQPLAVMSFDDPATHKSPAQRAEEAARQADQELARQLEASWQSGHQAGLTEATERQRQEEAQHGMTVRARAGSLLADFSSGLDALKEGLAHEVMTLAMQLAERIACEQIRISKDALAPVLAESMKHISERYRHLEASVHPDDVVCRQSPGNRRQGAGIWQVGARRLHTGRRQYPGGQSAGNPRGPDLCRPGPG